MSVNMTPSAHCDFFFTVHGSAFRFLSRDPASNPYIYTRAWLLPMKSVLEKKRVCERERRDSMKRERKIEIENSDEEEDEYPSKGDVRLLWGRISPIYPSYDR